MSCGRFSQIAWIVSSRWDATTGFVRYPVASTSVARWPGAPSRTTGIAANNGSARTRRTSAGPSMPGISTSTRARSYATCPSCAPPRAASASAPAATPSARRPHAVSISTRILRLVALSSTTSTRRPRSAAASIRSPRAPPSGARSRRSVTWKVLPRPGSLSTQMRPPMSSTSCEAMASPRPVPPWRRVMEPSTWTNAPKIISCFSRAMPIPVSLTVTCSATSSAASCSTPTRTTTSPSSVNLMALPTRFATTCRRRPGSPSSASGTLPATSHASSSRF